jgi:hypothetical protein
MYGNGVTPVVGGAVAGAGLARTGFPVFGLMLLALSLIIGGLLLVRSASLRRGS